MVNRKRKPAVSPEQARKWLQRNEEDGESPPRIAQADGYDVRTVRKQLGVIRQEREIRDARHAVLRQALEKHYVDICSFTEQLHAEISGRVPSMLPVTMREKPMWRALRQHLPRSPLWKNIDKLEKLVDPFTLSLNRIEGRIRKKAASKPPLDFVSSAGITGLSDGLVMSIVFHLKESARGAQGMKGMTYTRTANETGVRIQHGSYGIALVPEEKAADVEALSRSLMEEALQWQEYDELRKLTQDFMRTQQAVKEELTRIILRRVLPGKCIYCPF